jgi:glycosyltransferase involved in cell wall biosynthesis
MDGVVMKKKKLLIVAHHLTIGGVQKSLISALKAIDYEKFDVTLYLRKNRTDLFPFVDERINVIINDDKHHYYRKPLPVILQILISVFNLSGKKDKVEKFNQKLSDIIVKYTMDYEKKRFFSSEKYDIAIAYVHGYPALFVAECVDADKKFVFYHTSTDELHNVHEKIIGEFSKVVAIHNEQKELIKQWYPQIADRITIVENYCDKALIEEQSKEFSIEKPEDKTILCSCGRFSPVKGFDLAIETAKILKDKNIKFLWYFVGDGPERVNIEKLIEKYNLQEGIYITGMQKNPYPYINACDMYVQPSYEESLGLTILEAHRLCTPVIATKTMGGLKTIEDNINGVLCDINAQAIAEAIEKLMTDKATFENIKANLNNTDYSEELNKYKTQWQNLLEE